LQDKNSNQEKDFSAQPGIFLSVVCEKIPTPEKGLKKKAETRSALFVGGWL
jgi:hypothetical protein